MTANLLDLYKKFDCVIEKGEGSYLYDVEGNKYLDFISGIATNSLGHANPIIIEAINQQAQKLLHASNLFHFQKGEEVAGKLASFSGLDKVCFTSSGAESIEAAIKFIRKYFSVNNQEDRNRIITFSNSFHGRTIATVSACHNPAYTKGCAPLLDGFDLLSADQSEEDMLRDLENMITDQTAGILFEPVAGEGGIRAFSCDFLQKIRGICDKHGLLLALDEVQCGVGRTGTPYYYIQAGIKPDILTSAKGLGSGFPVGACIVSNKVADSIPRGFHGSTFSGNPLALAVVNAVLSVIDDDSFLGNVRIKGEFLKSKLDELKRKYPKIIDNVVGVGLMRALVINENCPVENLVPKAFDRGLLVIQSRYNMLRLLPPLTISEAEIEKAYTKLDNLLQNIA